MTAVLRAVRDHRSLAAIFWAACPVAMLWVLVVNGGPLVYFDSMSYAEQGHAVLDMVLSILPVSGEAAGAAGAAAGGGGGDAETVNLTRSAVYSVLVDIAVRAERPLLVPMLAAAATFATAWLVARQVRGGEVPVAAMTALPLVAAGTASLPFYVAYIMPDIYAPLLILSAGLLAVYRQSLTLREQLAAFAILVLAVVLHPSHLLLAAGLVPVAALIGVIVARRRWWIGALALVLAAGIGVAERKVVEMVATSDGSTSAVYLPLLTARLIEDGPGYTYLADNCPNRRIPSCALYDRLQEGDDPMRLTATHIVFERSDELGSFQHLDLATQKAIGDTQVDFLRQVVLSRPFDMAGALIANTLEQARQVSIHMTIAAPRVVADAEAAGIVSGAGRLSQDLDWLGPVRTAHTVIYALSLLAIAALLVWPGALSRQHRALAVFVLLGILANAFVCGGISQPADRYGARVAWLLPFLATLLLLAASARRTGPEGAP
ncbi:hypothetical protein HKCCE2091_02850 [Rhodobacterales bacterium HKCCE2091]|nr:hypothetical protein [Rhodobacterales bacterium HKCCE2091]